MLNILEFIFRIRVYTNEKGKRRNGRKATDPQGSLTIEAETVSEKQG